jgi:hypothetical protein
MSVSPTQHKFLKSSSNSNSDTIKNILIIYIHTVSPNSIHINLPLSRIRITFLPHIQFPINWQRTSFRRITERGQHTQATRYPARHQPYQSKYRDNKIATASEYHHWGINARKTTMHSTTTTTTTTTTTITAATRNIIFTCCFVWVWNLVAHIEGGT